MKKMKGFTLIELIVVICIIGVLAMIIVPMMLGYVRTARIQNFNSNAASAYKGAQLATVDRVTAEGEILKDMIYINTAKDSTVCESIDGTDTMDLVDYVGRDFKGYFGFKTNDEGSGCLFAIWSDQPLTSAEIQNQLSEEDVKNVFYTGSGVQRGCHPLKANVTAVNNNNNNNNNGG